VRATRLLLNSVSCGTELLFREETMPNVHSLRKIEHIVVLMLENRSFDNLLGWLYDPGERCAVQCCATRIRGIVRKEFVEPHAVRTRYTCWQNGRRAHPPVQPWRTFRRCLLRAGQEANLVKKIL
jgi:hypothetical protein